ncbi:alpha/beta hydrolase fold domain-containing protein [Kordia sp.]|uniref:alpha/beta hydrolase fold domain-containing protein n=1 Tax=Kordia sp. TaxID=1965332 RepID=UPI003D2727DC
MRHSLTYYITILVIKLKGLKKKFSQNPIDFKKLRKEDVQYPKGSFFKQNIKRTFKVSNSLITEIGLNDCSENLLLFIHGGAFISGPAKHHWDTIKKIAQQTDYTIWMCDYPKAPENKITEISKNIDGIYTTAIAEYQSSKILLLGDSVGGTLIASLLQRLVKKSLKLPHKIILVSPVMDASMSNPEIEKVEKKDPMLSKIGVVSAKRMCIEDDNLRNILISPVYGSFEQFPQTILFLAENDITYPDQKIAVRKLLEAKVDLEIIEGKNMLHIWPFLPVMKEAKISLNEIIRILQKNAV